MRPLRTHKRLLGLALAVALVSTLGSYRMAAGDTGALPVVPDFVSKDLDGKPVSFYSLKAKAYVINLWATYCVPCKKEIPDFNALQKKYQDQGLQIIGLDMDDEGAAVVKPFTAQTPIQYTLLIGDFDAVEKALGEVKTLPDTYFIDSHHQLRATLKELQEGAQIEKNIQALLAAR